MATPHRCWVILVGDVPTSFRAREREDLVPAFKQLQRTQPTVALRWFERGRVWESPDAAQAAIKLAATAAREKRPRREPGAEPRRGRDWRPGGEHKDPRARFELTRDQKRAKFKRNLIAGSGEAPETPRATSAPRAPRADTPASAPKRVRPKGDPFAD